MLIVRSPVRISFGGGGTDIPSYYNRYGGAVLSAAINKYFYTIVTKRMDDKIQVISSDLRVIETWKDIGRMQLSDGELSLPLAVMKDLEVETALNLFLASEIPPGTGLGSSATVCVSILKALSTYLQVPLGRYQLAERAFHIARDVLGMPVGKQDEYAAAFGGLNYISFQQDGTATVEPVSPPQDVVRELQRNLMLFFTGVSHNSWSILKSQEHSSQPAIHSLHEIRQLAKSMQDSLLAGNLRKFGSQLDDGWKAKRKISDKISNSRIDKLYELALSNGATGGKITGAGGGGFLLLYCEREAQEGVRSAFEKEGLQEMTFEFDFQGAQVVVNDPFLDRDRRCGLQWNFIPYIEHLA
jgi:D-glycero-alpha-D-manno-heptose-7-phosphate kinase